MCWNKHVSRAETTVNPEELQVLWMWQADHASLRICTILSISACESAACPALWNLNVKTLQYFSSRDVCNYLIPAASLFLFAVTCSCMVRATAIRFLPPIFFFLVFVGCGEKMACHHLHICHTHYETASKHLCARALHTPQHWHFECICIRTVRSMQEEKFDIQKECVEGYQR